MKLKVLPIKVSGTTINDPRMLAALLGKISDWLAKGDDRRVLVICGGGPLRGRTFLTGGGDERTDEVRLLADFAGMSSTIVNAVTFQTTLKHLHPSIMVGSMSNFGFYSVETVDGLLLPYNPCMIKSLFLIGTRVIVVGGGTGRPGVSTDTFFVQAALALREQGVDMLPLLVKLSHSVGGVILEDGGSVQPHLTFARFLDLAGGEKPRLGELFDLGGIRLAQAKSFPLFIGQATESTDFDQILLENAPGTFIN